MLVSLHVKNFAIIDEIWVDFSPGLNVLTGETGAGKSILLGSVGAALGGKISREMLGKNADYALAELVFSAPDTRVREVLLRHDLPIEDDNLVISRRITEGGRSISKINGEVVNAGILREVSGLLLDIHGQHEHQALLSKAHQRELLDRYSGEEGARLLALLRETYHTYSALRQELAEAEKHEQTRVRELSLVQYEYDEITEAQLRFGEDEELEERYRVLANKDRIRESVSRAEEQLSTGNDAVSEGISRALKELARALPYDERLTPLYEGLLSVEDQVTELNCQLGEYSTELFEDDGELERTEERLNRINRLKSKYGRTIEDVLQYAENLEVTLERLVNYDAYLANLRKKQVESEADMRALCEQMTAVRKKSADKLSGKIKEALGDLNFLNVEFSVEVTPSISITEYGNDEIEFLISTNVGEPTRPLAKIASGGELSRVMLALKSVFAGKDEIETLIFDEIDVGVSGRTAQRVAEKMAQISAAHQVLCITHLPQIAAMGDAHFRIEKEADETATRTRITRLEEEEISMELARILGGAQITKSVTENASEMRMLAQKRKEALRERIDENFA